jgi:hypothetical protein
MGVITFYLDFLAKNHRDVGHALGSPRRTSYDPASSPGKVKMSAFRVGAVNPGIFAEILQNWLIPMTLTRQPRINPLFVVLDLRLGHPQRRAEL